MVHPDKIFGRLGNRLFQMAYIFGQMKKGNIPDIYVQDPKYFEEYRDELKKLFVDSNDILHKVAIHVRRGDYVNNPFYVDLSQTDYYEKAIQQFPNSRFIVFSDDIAFCEDYFIGDEYEFCYLPELESMSEMISCTGHIIANSSFSWWGAFLSNSKKVIAPKNWYTDCVERTKCPNSWIKL